MEAESTLPRALSLLAASGSPEPGSPAGKEADLYGPLVGSWDIVSTWFDKDRPGRQGRGEWHFARILGGLGVQDVLFSAGAPETMRGTTLRCYDRERDLWHVCWMQPGGGEFVHLLGHGDGLGIVQEEEGGRGRERARWCFRDIGPDSFLWTGERSEDGGATWIREQEMRAQRMGKSTDPRRS